MEAWKWPFLVWAGEKGDFWKGRCLFNYCMIEKGENFDLLSVNDRRKHLKSIYFDKTNMYGEIKAIPITSGANIFWYVFGQAKTEQWKIAPNIASIYQITVCVQCSVQYWTQFVSNSSSFESEMNKRTYRERRCAPVLNSLLYCFFSLYSAAIHLLAITKCYFVKWKQIKPVVPSGWRPTPHCSLDQRWKP